MLRMRTTTYLLLGVLVLALIAAILLTVYKPLEANTEEDKGGVPHPSVIPPITLTAVSTGEIPTISVRSTVTPTPLRGRRYTNKAGGYSVIVPEGWKVEFPDQGVSFLIHEAVQNLGEPPVFRLQAATNNYDALKSNLSQIGVSSDACLELRHSIQVDGFPAERWACGDSEVRRFFVTVQRDSIFYWLGGAIYVKDWEMDSQIFEGILASIKFIPIETPPPVTSTAVPTSTPKPH